MKLRRATLIIGALLLALSAVLFMRNPEYLPEMGLELTQDGRIVIDDSSLFYGHKLATVMLIVVATFIIIVSSIIIEKNKPLTLKHKLSLMFLCVVLLGTIAFAILIWAERYGIISVIK